MCVCFPGRRARTSFQYYVALGLAETTLVRGNEALVYFAFTFLPIAMALVYFYFEQRRSVHSAIHTAQYIATTPPSTQLNHC